MTPAEPRLIEYISAMDVHGGSSNPAPHKALLIAVVTAKRAAEPDKPRLVPYSLIAGPLSDLLAEAGRSRRPWYPFVRMRNEPFWELVGEFDLNSSGDAAHIADLSHPSVCGGFKPEFDDVVRRPDAAGRVLAAACSRWLDPQIAAIVTTRLLPAQEGTLP